MKRIVTIMLGLMLAAAIPAASLAEGKASREAEMTGVMRAVLKRTQDPRQVAMMLERNGARFVGYEQSGVTFAYTGSEVVVPRTYLTTVGPDLQPATTESFPAGDVRILAGEKTDFTLTMWLYEWRNRDGTYTQQVILNGSWTQTEYPWIDEPLDVIDIRWIAGDLVYISSTPFDGVLRDQHTNGIASFTVPDQVRSWDLFATFKPVSSAVYGRWTNIFANFTHTW